MFIYFNQKKLAYHKGQLVPFFIVFIIAVIIAALVTVNVGKVAKTKTYSANAADAGVLAAASSMASAFNYIAVANTQMIVNYQYFFGLATVSFIIGYATMASAIAETATAIAILYTACMEQSCCRSCVVPPVVAAACAAHLVACALAIAALKVAIGSVKLFKQTMQSLIVQVTGFYATQFFFYKKIRENVDDYYRGALNSGYSFAFNNSGIASKLKGCRPENIADNSADCDACEQACERDCKGRCGVRSACLDSDGDYDNECLKNYSDCREQCSREELNCLITNCDSQKAKYQLALMDNLDLLEYSPNVDDYNTKILNCSWLDGQQRTHDVAVKTEIDPVNEYALTHTVLPHLAETAALGAAWASAEVALGSLTAALADACGESCSAIAPATKAILPEIIALTASIFAHAGLAPNGNFSSTSDNDAWPYLICWIDAVPHDYEVEVYQTQRHQGADLGVWNTDYPATTSSARANFAGHGQIYQPIPYYDASITLTDFLTSHLLGVSAGSITDVQCQWQ